MNECQTCALIDRRNSPDVPPWDSIFAARYFDVTHAYSTSLPGWTIIVCKRHIAAVHDMSAEEARELGELILLVSRALKFAVGCAKTYVMQFAEQPGHNHVHFHVVPRMDGIPDENKGANVFNYLNVDSELEVSEIERSQIAIRMREVQSLPS